MLLSRRPLKFFSSPRGFTLIEVLVAVMILAISLVVIMQLFSGGLKSNKISSDYLHGIFHAMEKMEELLLAGELLPGTYSGEFGDGYRWQAEIEIMEETDGSGEADPVAVKMPVATMRIQLNVSWKSGLREKQYRLSTTSLIDKKELAQHME